MSTKVAITSSDNLNVDLHFGQASEFLIYELRGDNFELVEKRAAPANQSQDTEELNTGSGCGGCGNGSGGGCCAGGGGVLSPVVENLLDCRAIVAAQIGGNVRRQFERNAISCFDIELPVEEALEKLAAYYKKIDPETCSG